mmetsp:Transcript_68446/g.127734  ORF Transcript_68446/g.127734 Transcript_68446/m.127734 type:complete len:221 (-) Transcript_68446:87-749(-)
MASASSEDRDWVLRKVTYNGLLLGTADDCYKSDREIVLAAVMNNSHAMQYAAESCKADREIVLEMVKRHGRCFELAAREFRSDHEIVLTAVRSFPPAVLMADETCRNNREIMQAAITGTEHYFKFASDELLEDSTFAPKTRMEFFLLKITMLSGQSAIVCAKGRDTLSWILQDCCSKLEVEKTESAELLNGCNAVPATAIVSTWPGIQPKGQVTEYQLVL